MPTTADPAYETCNEEAPPGLLFLCDHASNQVPAELNELGLPHEAFATHIASDIGAAALTRALAVRLNAPAILARWSRLVVDLNRGADDPTVVMKLSDGRIVPGNAGLDRTGIEERIRRYFAPYHDTIAARLAKAMARNIIPTIISMHSFTPIWRGTPRPWHVGVLWDRDGRLARPLIRRLAQEADWITGDNEPYSGELENDCLFRHGTMNGLPHVLIEIRQDLIADEAGIATIANQLEAVLRDALKIMGTPRIAFSRPLRKNTDIAGGSNMDDKMRTELEAAAFRRLVSHLRSRTDVQNIDLMNLAGFCRNCLGDWYREAAAEKGISLDKDGAREIVYGMAPSEWKKRYQKDASPEAQAAFAKSNKTHS